VEKVGKGELPVYDNKRGQVQKKKKNANAPKLGRKKAHLFFLEECQVARGGEGQKSKGGTVGKDVSQRASPSWDQRNTSTLKGSKKEKTGGGNAKSVEYQSRKKTTTSKRMEKKKEGTGVKLTGNAGLVRGTRV